MVDIDLPAERSVETRESERYFRLVTRVREALRQRRADRPGATTATVGQRGRSASGPRAWREGRRPPAIWLPAVGVFVIVLVVWEVGFRVLGRPVVPDPAPTVIGEQLAERTGRRSRGASCFTGTEAVVGLIVGVALGTAAGFATARWASAREVLLPVAIGASTIPIIAFAPITLNWFGPESLLPRDHDRRADGLVPGHGQHDPRPDERRSGRAGADVVVRGRRRPDAGQAARPERPAVLVHGAARSQRR